MCLTLDVFSLREWHFLHVTGCRIDKECSVSLSRDWGCRLAE